MNLFELFVKIGVDDQASGKLKYLGEKLGNGLKTAAKIGTAAVGAAAAGITALTAAAVNNYAEYEQLVGGVETLFKGSAEKVQEYAANAYKTAGMSANEYMSTVTSFSASLLQSLGGDTDKAAEYANQALTDMSDNANKMGTSMEMIQNAYQGFAKQNYTMLDNLKLGYGGTQSEMQRLIKDAAALDSSIDANSMSFGNIVKAINVVQTEMGITGTTAKEAASTIQGSVGMMKSSWTNLITGISDENANLDVLITNFVDSVGTVAQNIVPKIGVALNSASKLISDLIPVIVQEIPVLIEENLPILVEAAVGIVQSLMDGISKNQEMLFDTIFGVVTYLAESFITMLPQIVQLGLDLIVSLANGIAESLPELIPTIIDVILQIVNTLTNPETLVNLVNAGIQVLLGVVTGLIEAIPQLIEAIPTIITNLITALLDSIPLLIDAGIQLIVALVSNIPAIIAGIVKAVPKIITGLIDAIIKFVPKLAETGLNLIKGLWNGIKDAGAWLWDKISGFFGGIVDKIKGFFGIHSPSRLFRDEIGKMMAKGIGVGFDDEFANVKDDMEDALNFDDASVGINASIRKVGSGAAGMAYGGTSIGNITINIDGAKYTDEQSLASAIALEIQNMTDRRAAVYA